MESIDVIMSLVMEQGLIAGLFIYLFVTTQRRNKEREDKLQDTLEKYNDELKNISIVMQSMNDTLNECSKHTTNNEK